MQVEWLMLRVLSGAPKGSLATVTNRDFRQTQVQCEINNCGCPQAGIEVNRAAQRHENQADDGKQDGDCQADSSIEVSLDVKVGLSTAGADVDLVTTYDFVREGHWEI